MEPIQTNILGSYVPIGGSSSVASADAPPEAENCCDDHESCDIRNEPWRSHEQDFIIPSPCDCDACCDALTAAELDELFAEDPELVTVTRVGGGYIIESEDSTFVRRDLMGVMEVLGGFIFND